MSDEQIVKNKPPKEKKEDIFNALSEKMDTDIILLIGDIDKGIDEEIINLCRVKEKKKNVLLIIKTRGGSPDIAYRISRCLQQAYQTGNLGVGKFSVFIDSFCQSAGTLICLGADELIMSGNGHLSPLDMQVINHDLGRQESSLIPFQSISYISDHMITTFIKSYIRFNEFMTHRRACEFAKDMAISIITPLITQIDPLKLGEIHRSMDIAQNYGKQLIENHDNLKQGALRHLITGYPSHGYVIDRMEAKKLFNKVLTTKEYDDTDILRNIGNMFNEQYPSDPSIRYMNGEKK